ncbi:MAG: hypothetical protein K8U57_29245 [Planctomycetes bacterium]|nr:hypothetical protein [Planctomycetota bacterium]
MTTLDDAWRWYGAVRQQSKLTRRLAGKYWGELPWEGSIGRDAFFREMNPEHLGESASLVTDQLDDLAVLVLFSVFEATVRETVLANIRPEVEQLRHPSLRHAAEEACEALANGSFFRVLEPFKADGHANLIEQVNQVRRYRNWVAHGRRGDPPATVDPEATYDRLSRFLTLLLPPS